MIRLVGTTIGRSVPIDQVNRLIFGGQRPVFDKRTTPFDAAAHAINLFPILGVARVVCTNGQRPPGASVSTPVETSTQRIGDQTVVDHTILNSAPKTHLPVGLKRKTKVSSSTQVLIIFAIGAALRLPTPMGMPTVIAKPKANIDTPRRHISLVFIILGAETLVETNRFEIEISLACKEIIIRNIVKINT